MAACADRHEHKRRCKLDAALKTGTLPGEWISPYYELDDEGVLELVNELLPVYTQPITEDILNIRHR